MDNEGDQSSLPDEVNYVLNQIEYKDEASLNQKLKSKYGVSLEEVITDYQDHFQGMAPQVLEDSDFAGPSNKRECTDKYGLVHRELGESFDPMETPMWDACRWEDILSLYQTEPSSEWVCRRREEGGLEAREYGGPGDRLIQHIWFGFRSERPDEGLDQELTVSDIAFHREDGGPAYTEWDPETGEILEQSWYVMDHLHRLDGPARIRPQQDRSKWAIDDDIFDDPWSYYDALKEYGVGNEVRARALKSVIAWSS